jgi:hypothetical protein
VTEKDLKAGFLKRLVSHFAVHEEVEGKHFTGRILRLDAVVQPRDTSGWKNQQVALGIEFKDVARFARNYDTKDLTSWLAQCVDYSNTKWGDYGYIYIFACPSLVDEVAEGVIGRRMFVRNFMGQLGIGELKEHQEYGLTFLLNTRHRMWSELNGVEQGKYWRLTKKFGSR